MDRAPRIFPIAPRVTHQQPVRLFLEAQQLPQQHRQLALGTPASSAMRGELAAVAGRCLRQPARRGFHNGSRLAVAHSFSMPAMSPTMTEGNIASWKVKEGDTFTTGDVLVEIETDKASIDVEAQDDGIMAKIIAGDGTKGLPVGSRIAVTADIGDDIATLEIPAEETAAPAAAPQPPPETPPAESSSSSKAADRSPSKPAKPPGNAVKQTYPLYPSVVQLLHENGLDASEADKIPATGPSGRLLKGDVLAHLGSIDTSAPSKLAQHFEKLSHLDLSNIKIVPAASKPQPAKEQPKPQVDDNARIALSISFDAIREVQQRVHDALGIDVPLHTFITRAIEISNTELPVAKSRAPTADELFNEVLGLDTVPTESDGSFYPQIVSLAHAAPLSAATVKQKRPDIIDMLTGSTRRAPAESRLVGSPVNETSPSSVFALTVPKAEERRAKVFLERMKTVLQVDPGRLVL